MNEIFQEQSLHIKEIDECFNQYSKNLIRFNISRIGFQVQQD